MSSHSAEQGGVPECHHGAECPGARDDCGAPNTAEIAWEYGVAFDPPHVNAGERVALSDDPVEAVRVVVGGPGRLVRREVGVWQDLSDSPGSPTDSGGS